MASYVKFLKTVNGYLGQHNDAAGGDALQVDVLKLMSTSEAPLVIANASAPTITNLDADKVDGKEASAFLWLTGGNATMAQNLAMGSYKITGLADGSADGDAVNYAQLQAVAAQGKIWKEILFYKEQLKDNDGGNNGGIFAAQVLGLTANLQTGDIITLYDGTNTENFEAGGSGGNINFTIGADINATLENLGAVINGGSIAVSATTGELSTIDPTNNVLIVWQDTVGETTRIYGNAAAAARVKIADPTLANLYEAVGPIDTSSDFVALPTSQPAGTNFGFSRAYGSLITNETHYCRVCDSSFTWDPDDGIWQQTGSASIPNASTTDWGKVKIDAAGAIDVSAGIIGINVDASTITINGSNELEVDVTNIIDTASGLTETDNEIQINNGNGLTFDTGALTVEADTTSSDANIGKVVLVASEGVAVRVDNSTIVENGSNQLSVKALGIGTTQLINGSVTNDKLGADAVTGAKIEDDAVDSEHIAADAIDDEHINWANAGEEPAGGTIGAKSIPTSDVWEGTATDVDTALEELRDATAAVDAWKTFNIDLGDNLTADGLDTMSITSTQLTVSGNAAGKTLTLGLCNLAVDTAQLAGTSVTAAKLGSDVAGAGLTGGNGSAIAVATDGICDSHINWGPDANQVNASDLPTGSTWTGTATDVDAALEELKTNAGNYLPLAGGNMSGDIDMCGNDLLNVGNTSISFVSGAKIIADNFDTSGNFILADEVDDSTLEWVPASSGEFTDDFETGVSGNDIASVAYVGNGSDPLNTWRKYCDGGFSRCSMTYDSTYKYAGNLGACAGVNTSGNVGVIISRVDETCTGCVTLTYYARVDGCDAMAWPSLKSRLVDQDGDSNPFELHFCTDGTNVDMTYKHPGELGQQIQDVAAQDTWFKVEHIIDHDNDTVTVKIDDVTKVNAVSTTDATIGSLAFVGTGWTTSSGGAIDNVVFDTGAGSAAYLQLKDAGVTATQLAASVAGNGLTGGNGSAIAVDLYASAPGLEFSGGKLKVAYDGITIQDSGGSGLCVNVGNLYNEDEGLYNNGEKLSVCLASDGAIGLESGGLKIQHDSSLCINGSNQLALVPGAGGAFSEVSGVVQQTPATSDYTEDFVFGSPTLDDAGCALHDNRLFFDKSKGAFRAGFVSGTDWDNANLGCGSVAFTYAKASGLKAFAVGSSAEASGDLSAAIGYSALACSDYSLALGNAIQVGTSASDACSSIGIGLDYSVAGPYCVTQANTLAIMGGKVGIGTAAPTVELEVNGCICASTYYGEGTELTGVALASFVCITDGSNTAVADSTADTLAIGSTDSSITVTVSDVDNDANIDLALSSCVAGDGITLTTGVLSIDYAANNGFQFTTNQLAAKVDGSTICIDASTGFSVVGGGITATQLAANSVNDLAIDWGTGANQVSAVDVPIADACGYFVAEEVETALAELYEALPSVTGDYLKVDGSCTMAGDLDMGGYNICCIGNTSLTFVSGTKVVADNFDTSGNFILADEVDDSTLEWVAGTAGSSVDDSDNFDLGTSGNNVTTTEWDGDHTETLETWYADQGAVGYIKYSNAQAASGTLSITAPLSDEGPNLWRRVDRMDIMSFSSEVYVGSANDGSVVALRFHSWSGSAYQQAFFVYLSAVTGKITLWDQTGFNDEPQTYIGQQNINTDEWVTVNISYTKSTGAIEVSGDFTTISGQVSLADRGTIEAIRIGISDYSTGDNAYVDSYAMTGSAAGSVGYAQIKDSGVTSTQLGTGAVTSGKIQANAVGVDAISTSIAGDGLTGGAGDPLSIDADTNMFEFVSEKLSLKAGGVDATQIAADAVDTTKIDWGTIDDQVSAIDVPIADADGYFDTDYVEDALAQLAEIAFTKMNAGESISAGDVVYSKYDGVNLEERAYLAQANDIATTYILGIALNSASVDESVTIQAIGLYGGLSFATGNFNKPVYLSNDTAGGTTTTAPSSGFIYVIGRVVNATTISIDKGTVIAL